MNEQVLKMKIQNIKGIKLLDFEFPLRSGIYAITGENGSGKSTLISCASSVFYQMPMIDFFGRPENASINFILNEMTRSWECDGKTWTSQSSKNRMNISGFYEGSIIFGNRFKDTNISTINKLDNLTKNDLLNLHESLFIKI